MLVYGICKTILTDSVRVAYQDMALQNVQRLFKKKKKVIATKI